jgi:hypothetical protein
MSEGTLAQLTILLATAFGLGTPTRRHADTPIRPYAHTPIRPYAHTPKVHSMGSPT